MRILEVIRTSEGGGWIVPLIEELVRRGHDVIVVLPDPHGSLGRRLSSAGATVA